MNAKLPVDDDNRQPTMPARKQLPEAISSPGHAHRRPQATPGWEPSPGNAGGIWTEKEEEILRRDYKRHGSRYVARLLGRSSTSVKLRASRIGVDGRARRWTVSDIECLKQQYGQVPIDTLARQLGRNRKSVMEKAASLGLKTGPERWSASEIDELFALYEKMPATEIARRLGRPVDSLRTKARELGLGRAIKPLTAGVVQTIMRDVGHVPIRKIAEAVGMSHKRVAEIASAHGYHHPRSPLHERWRDDNDEFLRKHYASTPVIEIARHLGCSPNLVQARAMALGFSIREEAPTAKEPWRDDDDELLRALHPTCTDAELAEELGRSVAAVKGRATALGLRRAGGRVVRRWTAKDDAMLRRLCTTESREEIARRMGRTVDAIRHRAERHGLTLRQPASGQWTAREDFLLRQLSKRSSRQKIAERLGRTETAVHRRMQRLGLNKPRTTQFKRWTGEEDHELATLFGTVPAREIAEQLDRSVTSITMRARKLGLGAYAKPK